jgi:hypothetical protein
MPEILTESFCERCGTRYTFESAAPRKTRRLGQIKTLSKGMKNWVMSDDTSLDEAMAAARNDDDRELTSHQLDAFHATFNFCMTCRQYTCGNCWNTAEGRCLTCAPHLGHEILPAPFPEQPGFEPIRLEVEAWPEVDLSAGGAAANGHDNGHGNGLLADAVDPWAGTGATVDEIEEIDPAARLAFLSGETPAPAAAPQPPTVETAPEAAGWQAADDLATSAFETALAQRAAADAAEAPEAEIGADVDRVAGVPAVEASDAATNAVAAEPDMAAAPPTAPARPVVEPLPPTVEGKADAGAARTADLLRRFRPGQNIDAELAAFEAGLDLDEVERQRGAFLRERPGRRR